MFAKDISAFKKFFIYSTASIVAVSSLVIFAVLIWAWLL